NPALWNLDTTNSLRWILFGFVFFFLVVFVVRPWRFKLALNKIAADPIAVEQRECGTREVPSQHANVALDSFEKQPAGVISSESIEIWDDRDIEARLQDQCGDD